MKKLIYWTTCLLSLLIVGIPILICVMLGYSPYYIADFVDRLIIGPLYDWAWDEQKIEMN